MNSDMKPEVVWTLDSPVAYCKTADKSPEFKLALGRGIC